MVQNWRFYVKLIGWIIIILLLGIAFLLLSFLLHPFIMNHSLPSRSYIDNITRELSHNTSDIYDIARNTSKFVNETINHKTWQESWKNPLVFRRWFITRYPFTVLYRIYDNRTTAYLLNSQIGACGEHAYLFSYLMSQMNISAPIINLNSGTHAINEIRKDGEILIVDSSHNAFNESRENEMFPNKQIKYAELIYLNGTTIDYTEEYARESTGKINIRFLLFNRPLRNKSINFVSGVGIDKLTDNEGYIKTSLGNYTYRVKYGNIFLRGFFNHEEIKIVEEKELRKEINFKFNFLAYVIIFLTIVWIVLFVIKVKSRIIK